MLHIPILREGDPYRSLDAIPTPHLQKLCRDQHRQHPRSVPSRGAAGSAVDQRFPLMVPLKALAPLCGVQRAKAII
jgi:hypothetical protein